MWVHVWGFGGLGGLGGTWDSGDSGFLLRGFVERKETVSKKRCGDGGVQKGGAKSSCDCSNRVTHRHRGWAKGAQLTLPVFCVATRGTMSSFDFSSGFCYCLSGDGIKNNRLRGFRLLSNVEPTFLGAGTGVLQFSQGVEDVVGELKGTGRAILLSEQSEQSSCVCALRV